MRFYDDDGNRITEAQALGQSGVRRTRPLPDMFSKLTTMFWPSNPWFGPDPVRQAQEDYAVLTGAGTISGPDKEAVQAVAEAYLEGGERSEFAPTTSMSQLNDLRCRIRKASGKTTLAPEGIETKGFTFLKLDETLAHVPLAGINLQEALAQERIEEAQRHMAEYLTSVIHKLAKRHREMSAAEAQRAMVTGEDPREIRLEVRWNSTPTEEPTERVEAYLTAEDPDPKAWPPYPWGHPYGS